MRNRFCLALLLFCPAIILGQATFGAITGTVTDSTGAVVPNTEVQVTNQGTNISTTSTTGDAGPVEQIQTRDLAGPRNGLIGARIDW